MKKRSYAKIKKKEEKREKKELLETGFIQKKRDIQKRGITTNIGITDKHRTVC